MQLITVFTRASICQLSIKVYFGAILVVSAWRILIFLNIEKKHFRNISPFVLALYSIALYYLVCCQNLVTNSLTTFRRREASLSSPWIYFPTYQASHLSDIWYNIDMVEVSIVQIADYKDCLMTAVISNYVRLILKCSNKWLLITEWALNTCCNLLNMVK